MIDPKRIWSSAQLPTLPSVAIRLLEISRDPDTEIKAIVEVIRTDPAITAKILKATNSSFFGFTSTVTSVDRAVPLLGTTVVTSLALSFSLVEAAMTSGPMATHYNAYWMQSIVQAVATEILAARRKVGLDCEYFLSGLLIDIGRLAMLKTISKEYLPVLEYVRDEQRDLFTTERELLGVTHVDVGVKLMEDWKLPASLANAARLHHASLEEINEHRDTKDFPLIQAVAVSSAIGEYFCGVTKGTSLQRLRMLSKEFYDISDAELNGLIATVRARVDEAGELFSADSQTIGDPGDLMSAANEHLAQMAVREHVASTQATLRQQEIEEQKRQLESQNRELQQQALFDPLTKVYNRNFFNESLAKEIDNASRTGFPVGVIFADIDHFKILNDTYGHQFGDLVLQRVATAFGSVLRSSDVLARYGGEEFVVLVHQPTEKGLQKLAERIRERIETERVYFADQPINVTLSIGVAITVPDRGDDDCAKDLVASADQAMYESKRNGRNRVNVRCLINEVDRRLIQLATVRRFSRWLVAKGVFDIPSVSEAVLRSRPEHKLIGELARSQNFLTARQVTEVLEAQRQNRERFGIAALKLGYLNEDEIAYLMMLQQEEPISLTQEIIDMGLLDEKPAISLLKQFLAECVPARTNEPVPT